MGWERLGIGLEKMLISSVKLLFFKEKTEVKTMMKKTTKKLLGGVAIVLLLATIGTAFVTAETSDSSEDEKMFGDCMPQGQKGLEFGSELTEDQVVELQSLRESLIESDATEEEIHDAIAQKLIEFGIDVPTRDDMLDSKIESTSQHLSILTRQKELRELGYSWEEIQDIIAEEFEVEPMENMPPGGMRGGQTQGLFGGMGSSSHCQRPSGMRDVHPQGLFGGMGQQPEVEESLDSEL